MILREYEAGDLFGELALLHGTARATSIITKTECTLWKLDKATFDFIVKNNAL